MKKAKKIFFDIVSFGTPEAIIFNLIVILLILAIIPTSSLGYLPTKCIFKNIILPIVFNGECPETGIFAGCECPACGMTRAMSRLLHGDLNGAWNFNKGVFIVFSAMLAIIIINLRKLAKKIVL